VVATLVAATAGGSGLLLATAGTAHAAQVSSFSTLVPSSDWLNVAVAGGSTSPGAPIIQWWATGGAEQEWQLPANNTTGEIINQNSGMCITTDGVAGDQLFQEPCQGSVTQLWYAQHSFDAPNVFQSPTGLVMDVDGYAMYAGGHIDAWYENGQANQYFWSASDY